MFFNIFFYNFLGCCSVASLHLYMKLKDYKNYKRIKLLDSISFYILCSHFCHEDLQTLFLMAENNINFCVVFDITKQFMHIFISQFMFEIYFKSFFLAHNFNHDKCNCCTSFTYHQGKSYYVLFKKKHINDCTMVFVILQKISKGFRNFFNDFFINYYYLPGYLFQKKQLYYCKYITSSIIRKTFIF